MFLRKATNSKTGRTYLSIVQTYHDKKTKSTKSITVKSLGYLDELEKIYPDPIAHFTEEAKSMNEQRLADNAVLNLPIKKTEMLEMGSDTRKNLGYAALSKIYHELGINTFLLNRQRHTKEEYDANDITKLLVFSRLLFPASKKKTFEVKDRFFEKFNFSLDDVYRCLSFIAKKKDDLETWLNERIKKLYGRDTSLVYYDVTNYYFEIDEQDEMRRNGVSKEHRPDPIIQMGLFMDNNGIPISYGLYPGNTLDKQTFRPMLGEIQKKFDLGRIIVVADRGMTTGDNIYYTLSAKDGYVLSYSVLGSDASFKKYVLDEKDYRNGQDGFKIKSRLYPREIKVTMDSGRKKKTLVDEKQVVFYSPKYAEKAKRDRAAAVEKARSLIANPAKYTRTTSQGAAKYVKNIAFDEETGEILDSARKRLAFNEQLLSEEEKYDGYYAIVTSEYMESDERIIDMYRGLWRIEESFKLTKSEFESRPVFLSTKDHIEAHFLTCFVALVLSRVLEYRMKNKYAVGAMLDSLRKASCSYLQENYYLFDYYDEILKDIGDEMDINFGRKYMSLGEIKKILADTKK
jgi:transposase